MITSILFVILLGLVSFLVWAYKKFGKGLPDVQNQLETMISEIISQNHLLKENLQNLADNITLLNTEVELLKIKNTQLSDQIREVRETLRTTIIS
jgi:FtsZ-binding cell division protein ZapB